MTQSIVESIVCVALAFQASNVLIEVTESGATEDEASELKPFIENWHVRRPAWAMPAPEGSL